MYTLVWTASFMRAAKTFIQRQPELRQRFVAILRDLESDPFQPGLHYHQLGGKLEDLQAVSITSSYRITLTILISEQEIILLAAAMTRCTGRAKQGRRARKIDTRGGRRLSSRNA